MSGIVAELKTRLKQAMEESGIKAVDLVEKTKIPKSSISQYLSGRTKPNDERIYLLSKALYVSEAWLMGYDVPKERIVAPEHTYRTVQIPVLGKVAAGFPSEACEDILDYVDIPEELAKHGDYFGLRISGHSMEPRIWDGDTVIVRRQEWVEDGSIAVVNVNGYDTTCKKVKYTESGVTLVSLNPTYEPMFFPRESSDEPFIILGRVVEIRSKI